MPDQQRGLVGSAPAVDVFDFVDDAAEELEVAKSATESISTTSAIRQFCVSFFEQFFAYVYDIEIVGVSMDAAKQVNVKSKRRRSESRTTRLLVRRYQHLCKIDPDLRGGDYGGGESVLRDFHEEFIQDMLDEIADWADDAEHPEISERAREVAGRYRVAVSKVT